MMKKKKISNNKLFLIGTIIYFVLNIVNTYFLTSNTLNRYLVTFDRTFIGELNAIIGNLAILLLLYCLTIILVKKPKKQLFALTMITLFLNIGIFSLTIFTKFYGTALSFRTLTIFKNPALELGFSILIESLKDLIVYYRIILFVPFALMLLVYFKFDRNKELKKIRLLDSLKFKFSYVFIVLFLLGLNISIFYVSIDKKWHLNSARTTYVAQNIGVYSFYVYEVLGDFKIDLTKVEDDTYVESVDKYNKNKNSYINYFDDEEYSNILLKDNASGITYYDSSLTSELNGVFKDKNLVLYHLESFNYFLYSLDEISSHMPFLKTLLSESYVLSNFYANVGIGTSADAEFSVLTGLYPTGNTTLYWDYTYEFDEKIELNSLVKYFNDNEYYTQAIHGDTPLFYNRGIVYDKLYNFDNFYHLDDFINDGYNNTQYNHKNPWISDLALSDIAYKKGSNFNDPYFMFLMNMMPHTPFLYDPYEKDPILFSDDWEKNLSEITLRYLRYVKYYDEVLESIFINPDDNSSRILDDTVYIFYGDHGSGLTIKDLEIIFDKDFKGLEYRKHLNNTLAFIYVPSENYLNNKGINSGLIKGENNLVRSQVDLYRTIIELFDLPVLDDPYFGVNLFSKEPTLSLDARVLDVVTDNFNFSLINNYDEPLTDEIKKINSYAYKRKLINDLYIYKNIKN